MSPPAGRAGAAGLGQSDFEPWHICGIIDACKTMPSKAEGQHCGLMTPTGEFCPEVEHAVQELSRRLYKIALGE